MLYSKHHIIFIVLFAVLLGAAVTVTVTAFKKDEAKGKDSVFIRCLGGLLAASVIFNRIALAVWDKSGIGALELIPNSYCGMTSLLLGLTVLFGKPDHRAVHFLFYVELVGGLATVFAPSFLGQDPSFFFLPTITGMNHHACGVILCAVLVASGRFRPALKNWAAFPLGICAYTLFGLFLIDPLGVPHSMCIDDPLVGGTPLYWWFVLPVGTVATVAVAFVYEKLAARFTNRTPRTARKT